MTLTALADGIIQYAAFWVTVKGSLFSILFARPTEEKLHERVAT